ncbi:metallophosphoesterase family protein [Aneurinibacillus tyrosinisolvens]|uniref:metallophosphoesterase family protein n=1 Tax=Aneurinibacillus tyrosinisolvens TaxID=1443435 RepID=UPI00063FC3D8|nr:metallophosphoesterase [Aneurinibacillus tyrosinisolvens]
MKKSKIAIAVVVTCSLMVSAIGYVSATTPQHSKESQNQDKKSEKQDELLFTFSSVGDDRADDPSKLPGLSKQDYKWLVNSKATQRMMREMHQQKTNMLFFNGDMIMGYTPNSNTDVLNRQYAFWRGMMSYMFENGTYVFPVPGNHEVQDKYTDEKGKTVKKATVANENTWRDNMGDIIIDQERFKQINGQDVSAFDPNNVPQLGTSDKVTSDQKQLDYSFDYKGTHFAVINTDPSGNDSHAPTAWLEQDLAAAQKRGVKHVFVFGHKMASTYLYDNTASAAGGLDAYPEEAKAFWNVIEKYKATYFSGHEHIFNVSQPFGGKAYQVLVGSGGSPFESDHATGKASDRMYSWVTVKVYQSGKVHIDAYGFDENYGPTKVIKSWNL